MICGFCGATQNVTFIGSEPRCRDFRDCWDVYIQRCDEEDARRSPKPAALDALARRGAVASGGAGDE